MRDILKNEKVVNELGNELDSAFRPIADNPSDIPNSDIRAREIDRRKEIDKTYEQFYKSWADQLNKNFRVTDDCYRIKDEEKHNELIEELRTHRMALAQMHNELKERWQKEVKRRVSFDQGTFGPADPDSKKQYTRPDGDVYANPPGYLEINASLRSFLDVWRRKV